jgi:putative membrane-bound dehydrogenase-like protein
MPTDRLLRAWLRVAFAGLLSAAVFDPRAVVAQGKIPGEKPLEELLPRIPGKTVDEALKTFTIQHGFHLEVVAAEPDVTDPIDAAFDENGRMYVVEMHDYPFLPEQRPEKNRKREAETWGRIRLLEDRDDDGRMDRSTIFADKLRWPQSVCCYDGGVFVITPPHLLYLKDADGDGVADVRDIVLSGFANTNVQGLANGLEWGLEHRIYFVSGLVGGELKRNDKPLFSPGRRDVRFNPKTLEFELCSGGDQFGHGMDDFGERFVCNNSNHIEHIVWPLHYLDRNPQLSDPGIRRSIAKEGAAAPVFRTSEAEPWRVVRTARRVADPNFVRSASKTEQVATGYFTSATGVTVYRGGAYPLEYYGNVFIGDVGANLVHRKKLAEDGISFVAERTEQNVEFLTSSDNWFRPANFVNAPDGTLYILDVCRETIEHPASIPEDIKAFLDLESGNDRGRIYRLTPPNWKRPKTPKLGQATTAELVTTLSSPDGWARDTAHRLIWERQDKAAIEPLRQAVKSSARPVTVVLALYGLRDLGALTPSDVVTGLKHGDAHVREHSLRLAESLADRHPDVLDAMLALSDDRALRVRWQLTFSLGEVGSPKAVDGLKAMIPQAANDSVIQTAWLSSVYRQAAVLANDMLDRTDDASFPLLAELCRQIAGQGDMPAVTRLLGRVLSSKEHSPNQARLLEALGEGLRRRGHLLGGLIAAETTPEELRSKLKDLFAASADEAQGTPRGFGGRGTGIRLLAFADEATAMAALPELFSPQTPPELQQAAVKSLSTQNPARVAEALLANWRGFGPAVRRDVVDVLVQSEAGALPLLAAITDGGVKGSEIERDKKQLLLNHPQEKVRAAARKVLDTVAGNRKQVVEEYRTALELEADAARGKQVYAKTCSVCHRVGSEGHPVGPDLVSVQNKSLEDLLIALMDPNREAQPAYINYTAQTVDGKVFTGIIAAENAASVTLKRAEAKQDVLQRENLETLVSSGQSLMPEGLEKDLTKQQVADVLAFIKSLPPEKKPQ